MSSDETPLDNVFRQSYFYDNVAYKWILGLHRNRPPITSDPVMDLVVLSPTQSAKFIQTMLLYGIITCSIMFIPSLVYLIFTWDIYYIYENKLSLWLAVNTFIQGVQIPIRYIIYSAMSNITISDNRVIIYCLSLITSGNGWKISRKITIINYFWFVMGMYWMNKTKARDSILCYRILLIIAINLLRMIITIILFHRTFPPNVTIAWDSPKPLSKSYLAKIPTATYSDFLGLRNESCIICISPFEDGQVLSILACDHGFHKECLEPWLHRKNMCPLCKNKPI